MGVRYSIWGAANRLKMESVGEMENSPFKDVYRRANAVLSNIVQSTRVKDEGSRRDEQVANVISFLGERGRGKTSAMLSFYFSLNKLHGEEPKDVFFCDVSYIDAAMLAENEFIIDVVLAKMWDKFDAFLKEPANVIRDAKFDYLVKQVRNC